MSGVERRIGPVGTALRVLVAVGLLYLAGGAQGLSWSATWYDAAVGLAGFPALTLLAWQAQPGCEVTVLSNWILHRDDQVGCPLFGLIDAAEARHCRRRLRPLSAYE